MKLTIIYKIFALALLVFVYQNWSTGPGAGLGWELTGAPGSTGNPGTCANSGCHTSGAFSPSAQITLLDGANPVSEYEPGMSYTLRVTGTAGSGSPSAYGFQAVALAAGNSQAGSWGNIGAGKHVVTLSNRDYIEHSSPSASNTFEMEWVAPGENTGGITFYAAVNLVNGNGSNSGDGVATATLSVSELPPSNASNVRREYANLRVFPNPVQNEMNLEISSRNAGAYDLRFVDFTGKIVRMERIILNSGTTRHGFQVSDLHKGFYILQLYGEGHIASTEILKL